MEDAELVRRLNEKDPQALEYLYAEYRDRVRAVVRRFIKDECDLEEVVQDTFWTVYRKIHLFRQDSALWSWMYRIAVNAAKMKIRKYKRYPIPLEDDVITAIRTEESINHKDTRPDEQLAMRRVVEEMHAFLEDCDETNRKLYIDMEVSGVPKEVVAEELDLTVPAVKTRLHRLRVGLRERLQPLYDQAIA